MTLRSSLIGLAIGALVTFPFLWLAMLVASVGQGTPYTGPRLVFPYAMLDAAYPKIGSAHALTIAYSQFPVYGLVLGAVYHSKRFRFFVWAVIVLHILAAAICLPYAPLS
jgi:hypothetical protein